MQFGQAHAHGGAELGVEVGQRLVEQEDLRLLDDGAPDGDALGLAAGQLLGQAVEQVLDFQEGRDPANAGFDLVAGAVRQTHAEARDS